MENNPKPVLSTEDKIRQDRRKRETKRRIRSIIIWVIVLAIIGFGVYLYNFYKVNLRLPWQEPAAPAVTKTVEGKVEQREYSVAVDISGSVEAYDTQSVKFRSSGTVTSVLVSEGDKVTKGQLLATLDDSDAQYAIESTTNDIEAAKIDGNASQLKLLEMKLKSQTKALENTKLYANFDGVVTSVNVDENDYFEAGSSVITIIDNSKLKATVEIDEIDIQNIKVGMTATVTSDSVPGKTMTATVSYIPMVGRYTSSGIGVMDVEILFEDFPEAFKPGFSFEGVIDVQEPQSMLLVPQNAVKTTRGVSTVQKKLSDGTTQSVEVSVKYLGEGYYQVLSGDIADGDTVMMQTTASTNAASSMMMSMSSGSDTGGGPGGGGGEPPQR
ncbi:MAG: efflux RND transporter periplasmic adaptor subunit [Sphaerochaetaceae bacterium]|nr:efflux RND transporter periplasmic adaptor subunit [Sphaerochaetaceae bacterium]MDD3162599.1 efflux RND transporter periplasmic adaptor subunit [Sphaerochaetaceae bacterium]MDD4006518.1 efflux RND transporter periplasmic adaptor subunit [Sphaerochaetaceae bacterium]MDD4395945.1 efflux RND transporter periplasmic adaptor subunit [Sphaerochaetaceae bacterium]